jgi:hypothetical protein
VLLIAKLKKLIMPNSRILALAYAVTALAGAGTFLVSD